jgi:hypothetical protein
MPRRYDAMILALALTAATGTINPIPTEAVIPFSEFAVLLARAAVASGATPSCVPSPRLRGTN